MARGFKATNPADVANLMVRTILCELGGILGGFDKNDWEATKAYFNHRCAYTGEALTDQDFVQDHLIPHNRKYAGLHIYGNIIPSSKAANAAKSSKSLDDFMRIEEPFFRDKGFSAEEIEQRKQKIKDFVAESKYDQKHEAIKDKVIEEIKKTYSAAQQLIEAQKADFISLMEQINNPVIKDAITKTKNKSDISVSFASSDEKAVILEKLSRWKKNPGTIVHKVIDPVAKSENGIAKAELITFLVFQHELSEAKLRGTLQSLQTNAGNSYGRALTVTREGIVKFHPDIEDEAKAIWCGN